MVRSGVNSETPFLDLTDSVSSINERGVLGLAFHPRYAQNGRFFVFYTATDGALTISEFARHPAFEDMALRGSERELLSIPHPAGNHNGGQLAFGPDGYLYIGVGDGGSAGDPPNNAQSLSTLLGKLLRIDVDGAARPYAIPPGNPFVATQGARPEIWAYGLRNPWRFSFDRATGDLFIGDVGQGLTEEVDYVARGTPAGLNFGWRVFEGRGCFNPSTNCSLPNHTPPVLQYSHGAAGGDSITGGYVYRGHKSGPLQGYYLYGDFSSNRVWAARLEATGWVTHELISPGVLAGITTFGEDEYGEIYVASAGHGAIYAIEGPLLPTNPALRCEGAACLRRRVSR